MRTLDRIFGWLMVASGTYLLVIFLVIGVAEATLGMGHYGKPGWTAGDGLAELLLGSCNLMRAERPFDKTLARVCVAGNLAWLALVAMNAFTVALMITQAIQLVLGAVLLLLSLRTLQRSRPM